MFIFMLYLNNYKNKAMAATKKKHKLTSTTQRTPVTPKLESTNSSKRKVSTDYRPQPK
jgi:hypothetical protein